MLRAFLELLPDDVRAAFEFRHASWHDPEVFDALRARNVALCVADSEKMSTPVEATADYAYFRLRDEGYQQADIERWAGTIAALPDVKDAFVYFKHEEQGLGPEFAQRLIAALAGSDPGQTGSDQGQTGSDRGLTPATASRTRTRLPDPGQPARHCAGRSAENASNSAAPAHGRRLAVCAGSGDDSPIRRTADHDRLSYAFRTLLRNRSFTVTAALTLALGIGATTAIFSVVNAVLLQPLPYRDPGRLVVTRLSYPDYLDVRRGSRSFDGTAAWASNLYNIESGDETRQVLGGVISRDLLPLLGVAPAIGHNFSADEDRQKTVILGYGLWQSVFGGDRSAIGRTLTLSGTPYTVVGVAPQGFGFPTGEFQLWTPMGLLEADAPAQAANRALRIFTAVARLRPGVSEQQARDELITISRDLAEMR